MNQQNMPDENIGKFVVHGEGVGIADEEMAVDRALELARSDGRTEYNAKDLDQARAELLGEVGDAAPEMPEGMDEVSSWNSSPGEAGSQAGTHTPGNDESVGEILLHDGMEEAEHDRRVVASGTLEEDSALSEG